MEKDLAEHIKQFASQVYGLSLIKRRELLYEFEVQSKLENILQLDEKSESGCARYNFWCHIILWGK